MRVLLIFVLALCFATSATAAPSPQRQITALQKQVKALNVRVSQLTNLLTSVETRQNQMQDMQTCEYAVSQDDINTVWHAMNVIAQYIGLTSQPDFPRYDDSGACSRIGVTRTR